MGEREDRRQLRAQALGVVLVAGGLLAGVSVALPPAATNNETTVVVLGAAALAVGLTLLVIRRRFAEPWLGACVALGTVVITVSTWAGGPGNGTADNEILYVWPCLYSFYFLTPRHAVGQLALVGAAYAWLLGQQGVPAAEAANQLMITLSTLLVAGVLVARLRGSMRGLVAELTARARHDSLTGLLNRRALEERGDLEFARRRREGGELSMLAMDLDGFKGLNDTLGHPAGDEVLREVSRAIGDETREMDAVARVGGDEFVVLLPGSGATAAQGVAGRLLGAARESGYPWRCDLSASVGVAVAEPETSSLEQLWAAADKALYEAKRAGADRVVLARARADGAPALAQIA